MEHELTLDAIRTYGTLAGISLRSLELYLFVYVTRYLDLFTTFYSLYNSVMKVFFICSTALAIYMIRCRLSDGCDTSRPYDPEQDSFQHFKYVVLPVALVSLFSPTIIGWRSYYVFYYGFDLLEILWRFSIYLEAMAMLPQLVLVWRDRRVERWAGLYIFSMGLYRIFYILNWIYRAHTERNYKHHWEVYFCGVLQSVLYSDFFYYACTKRDRPLLAWRRTVATATSANAAANDPLLSSEEQMRIV